MALRHGADGYPQPCPPELWATSKAILCRRHRLFAAVIHLIANDDWRNMAQCSILHSSPPTPLKELDLTRPQLAGFFWSKFWLRHRFRFRFRRADAAGLQGWRGRVLKPMRRCRLCNVGVPALERGAVRSCWLPRYRKICAQGAPARNWGLAGGCLVLVSPLGHLGVG